MIQSASLMIWM